MSILDQIIQHCITLKDLIRKGEELEVSNYLKHLHSTVLNLESWLVTLLLLGTGYLSILIVSLDLVRHSEMCNCPSVIKSNDVHGQTYYTAKPRPSATPLTAPHSCSRTDRLHLPILRQDLLPHPLLLLPPVHGRTDYTCRYYTKTFCCTSYCSSLLITDRKITLAHRFIVKVDMPL